jgi:murein DD-endopeptidase MepM/ murein hydrolase activator NlpD
VSSRYEGRHRGSSNGRRIPQTFRPGFVLPTAAAATVVLTATGASMAESAPRLDLTGVQARAKAESAAQARADRLDARQSFELKLAASQARVAEEQRASRDQARSAVLKKQAAAAAQKAKAKALAAAEAKRKAERRWVSAIAGAAFTSGYGMRWGRMHQGNDFGCPVGTPVMAMSQGTVTFVGQESGYGNKVEIEYWDGTVSYYAHLSSFKVTVGQQVEAGDVVALSGNTGHSTGPHLHLEIHPHGGGAVDPAPWLHAHGLQ